MLNRYYIESKLIEIGMKPNLKGFNYVTDAVLELDKNPKTKWIKIYAKIASIRNVTAQSVERSIRTALDSARNNLENYDIVREYFGYENCENSATITLFYKKILNEYKSENKMSLENLEKEIEEKCLDAIRAIFNSYASYI